MKTNNFRFFIPGLDIQKGKDTEGNDVMKVKGVASTGERDTDEEFLDPEGFDLSYFKKSGFINWNHRAKDNAAAIIGEPTKANVVNGQFELEGRLYPNSSLAKEVYSLANILASDPNSTRKLGWSIEGKVLERDLLDPRKVKRAMITGVAITPTPKNPSTFLDIVKGHLSNDEFVYEESPNETEVPDGNVFREDELHRPENGGNYYIIDITKPDGSRVTVDRDFSITVIAKSLTTSGAGKALKREDVEGGMKYPQEVVKAIVTIVEGYNQGLVTEEELTKVRERFSK